MEIGFLKGNYAAEANGLSPFFFKDGGKVLAREIAKLLGSLKAKGPIPKVLYEWVIVTIYEKYDGSICDSRRGIGLASIAKKLLRGIIHRRLTSTQEKRCLSGLLYVTPFVLVL